MKMFQLDSDPWRIFLWNALSKTKVDAFHSETIRRKGSSEIGRQGSISSLVPPSRRYFERLVGELTEVRDYAFRQYAFDQLAATL